MRRSQTEDSLIVSPAISSPRSALLNLLLVLIGTLAAALLGEALVRVAIGVSHRLPLFVSSPRTGWAVRPDFSEADVAMSGGRFRLSTDRYGRRLTGDPTASRASWPARTVVLVGDSFVFGLGVDDRDTFAWLLAQRLPDHRIVNLGVPGWGTDQELAELEEVLQSRSAPRVSDIVVVVFENDFRDVQRTFDPYLGRRKPRFHINGTMLERDKFRLSPLDRLMDYSRLAWLVRSKAANLRKPRAIDSDSGTELVLACLGGIRRLGEASGARVHVFAYRLPKRRSTVSDSVWHEVLARAGALDLTEAVRSAPGPSPIGFDGVHWSAEGHRRVASVIHGSLTLAR